MNSTVWVNGRKVGFYPNGYTPFTYDITDFITADGTTENVIAVKVEHKQPSSRWYSGSGIYRDVELITTNPIHLSEYGVKKEQIADVVEQLKAHGMTALSETGKITPEVVQQILENAF